MATVSVRSLCVDKPAAGGRSTRILHSVSLDVADGELLVLIGPSGCGKSTLLRCIAGLEPVAGGEVLVNGRVVNDLEPRDRDIAMVFQSYALYPHMTVRENLAFALRLRRQSETEIRQRVEEAAELLAITPLLSRLPRELSGGQRQRVAMGRAIVRRPQVFLFDEPLSNLDAALRQQMRVELLRLHRTLGTTTIYVTHDQVEAMTLAHRIAVLRAGRLEQLGTPRDLYDRPRSPFVARFFGTPEMNLVPGQVRAGTFTAEPGGLTVATPGYAEGPATLGVRAEDLQLLRAESPAALPPDAVGQGLLDVVEDLGSEALAHVHVGGHHLIARSTIADLPPAGTQVALRLADSHWHLFSRDPSAPEGEARLLPAADAKTGLEAR
jgi:ABC-type sugar transport system ATPase subunit